MEKVPAELMKEYVNSQKFTSTTEIMEAMKAMFANPYAENILAAVHVDTQDHIGGFGNS